METKKPELMIFSSDASMPYNWAAGLYGSKFLQHIRDHKKFLGVKCSECGRVFVHPRVVCGYCFRKLEEWVELSDKGTVEAYTVVNYKFIDPETGEYRPVPYTLGYIKLDGADTTISHIIDELNPDNLSPGLRVQAVFKEERVGSLKDILHFKVIEENDK